MVFFVYCRICQILLEEISKKDHIWRDYAYRLCGCKMLADDLIQEMYLRFHRNPKTEVKDGYVYLTIKSVYFNYLKKERDISIENLYYLKCNETNFEPTDEEQELLDRLDEHDWYKIELLAESYSKSYREIEREFNINYGFVFKTVKELRNELLNKN